MLRDSVVVVVVIAVVRTRPRAIPLATITMRKSAHGFPFVSHIWDAYGAPLDGPSGRRSSATKTTTALTSFPKSTTKRHAVTEHLFRRFRWTVLKKSNLLSFLIFPSFFPKICHCMTKRTTFCCNLKILWSRCQRKRKPLLPSRTSNSGLMRSQLI